MHRRRTAVGRTYSILHSIPFHSIVLHNGKTLHCCAHSVANPSTTTTTAHSPTHTHTNPSCCCNCNNHSITCSSNNKRKTTTIKKRKEKKRKEKRRNETDTVMRNKTRRGEWEEEVHPTLVARSLDPLPSFLPSLVPSYTFSSSLLSARLLLFPFFFNWVLPVGIDQPTDRRKDSRKMPLCCCLC